MRREVRAENHRDPSYKEFGVWVLFQALMIDEIIWKVSLDGKEKWFEVGGPSVFRLRVRFLVSKIRMVDWIIGAQTLLGLRQPGSHSAHIFSRECPGRVPFHSFSNLRSYIRIQEND